MIQQMLAIFISGYPTLAKPTLYIWNISIQVLLKPSLENFEYFFGSVWDECNYVILWIFFGISFLWDRNGFFFFFNPVAIAEFSKVAGILSEAL